MKNVLVLFGGCSPEHEVSLRSAQSVLEHMDREKFRPLPVGITRQGRWLRYEGPCGAIGPDHWERTGPCAPALLSPSRGEKSLWALGPAGLESTAVDLAFPVLHGQNGEDGTVQGLLTLAGIPLAGCGVLSSALCMDKDRAHQLAARAGLRVPRSALVDRACPPETLRDLGAELGWPVFVKPLRAGSSFGVSRAEGPEDLPVALERALAYDSRALLEEAIPGVELGVAVLGTARPRAFGPDEVELAGGFFDYGEKYGPLTSRVHVPARISPALAQAAREAALTVYRALDCAGFARVDLFLTPDGELVFNEVNTIPGFTAHSRFPQMLRAAGLDLKEALTEILEEAGQP